MKFQAGLLYTDGRQATRSDLTLILKHSPAWMAETSGEVLNGPVAMVYRGWAVTREEEGEVQPLSRGPYTIAWDGRLDNRIYIAACADLDCSGRLSDSNIVLDAYAALGDAVLGTLIGEFACALWCSRTQRLVLARSTCGTRPLYYTWNNGALVWSTGFGHLVRTTQADLSINDSYIFEYLLSQPSTCHTPLTAVQSVAAGSLVAFEHGTKPTVAAFWNPEAVAQLHYRCDEEYEEHCQDLLTQAVSARISRVPGKVFAELSGGLDSSSVVLLGDQIFSSQNRLKTDLQTLSCVYEESDTCDESFFIREVEQSRAMPTFVVPEAEQKTTLGLDEVVFSGLPSPHHCFPGRYPAFVARMQPEGARLLLTGTGGDHLFWSGADGVPVVSDELSLGHLRGAHQACRVWSRATGIPWLQMMSQAVRLASGSLAYCIPPIPCWVPAAHFDRVRSLVWDFRMRRTKGEAPSRSVRRYLVNSLFATTGAGFFDDYSGIYISHPYTHRPLVEFCLALPASQLQRNGESRSIMRRALREVLPKRILNRQSKGALDECFARALQKEWRCIDDVRNWHLCQRGYAEPKLLLNSLQKARLGIRLEDQSLIRVCSLERWFRSLDKLRLGDLTAEEISTPAQPDTSLRASPLGTVAPPAIADAN